jgi:hypothetical protein
MVRYVTSTWGTTSQEVGARVMSVGVFVTWRQVDEQVALARVLQEVAREV